MNLQFRRKSDAKVTDNFIVHRIFLNGVSIGTITEYLNGNCSLSFQLDGSCWSGLNSSSFVEAKALVTTILAKATDEKSRNENVS